MKIGLTSVTFRGLSWREVIAVAKECGLDGIEWGGDVHAPPGDVARAKEIRRATEDAGLAVLSYGSYYRLGAGECFQPVLETARALGAGMIRVWAGVKRSADYTAEEREAAVRDAQNIAGMAEVCGITVALEYHRNTLTDHRHSAVALLLDAEHDNLKSYWQPNPELSRDENWEELHAVLPWLTYLHVFHWKPDGTRLRLEEGEQDWCLYIRQASGYAQAAILEFVAGDDPAQCAQDAKTLRRLCG